MPLSPAYTSLARLVLPLAAALLPAAGAAQVYKCVDRAGHTTYQQAPCVGGQSGAAIELSDPVLTVFDRSGRELHTNDNWVDGDAAEIRAAAEALFEEAQAEAAAEDNG